MKFNLKLKHKILSIALINILFFVISGFIYYYILNKQKNITDEILINQKAMSHFQDVNVLHDVIRGDVFCMVQKRNDDFEGKKTLYKEFKSHISDIVSNLDKISDLKVSDDVKNQIKTARPVMLNYIAYCSDIVTVKINYDSLKNGFETKLNDQMLKYLAFKDAESQAIVTKNTESLNNINDYTDKKLEELLTLKLNDFDNVFSSLTTVNGKLFEIIEHNTIAVQETFYKSSDDSLTLLFVVLFGFIIASVLISLFIANKLHAPILTSKGIVEQLAVGNLPPLQQLNSTDEIGEMVASLNNLTKNLTIVKNFANEVGQGKFDSDVKVFDAQGDLGLSLDGMRLSLKNVAEDDFKRNWSNVGLAKMGEILRNSNLSNTEEFYNNIVSFIVKYLNANQGGLFILNNEYDSDEHLELASCFAYDKRKFLEKRIEIGEGLIGQCFVEKEYILLTDVPDKYTLITSGLGEKTAGCIILVPLKVNDEINGVLEVAAFTIFEDYKIDFLNKLSENISSSIQNYKTSVKTNRLLAQTQQQAEEMKSQEEEMRQNLEEMQATQEEFYRKEMAYKEEIERLKGK